LKDGATNEKEGIKKLRMVLDTVDHVFRQTKGSGKD